MLHLNRAGCMLQAPPAPLHCPGLRVPTYLARANGGPLPSEAHCYTVLTRSGIIVSTFGKTTLLLCSEAMESSESELLPYTTSTEYRGDLSFPFLSTLSTSTERWSSNVMLVTALQIEFEQSYWKKPRIFSFQSLNTTHTPTMKYENRKTTMEG